MDFDDDTLRAIAQAYKEEGNIEFKKNEFRNALSFYTEGINVNCKDDQLNAILYTNRATSYFCLGDYQEALTDAKRAREFQPSYMKAIFRGAKACNELHLYEEAITWCDDGLAIEKENKALLEVKRKSVERQMKVKKGRPTDLKNKSDAVEHIEENRYTRFNVESLERDIQTCNQYLALSKESGNLTDARAAYYTLGIAYHKLGHLEKAIELFRKYHSICKETEDTSGEICACLNLAKTYQRTGDLTKAIEYHKVYLDICKDKRDRIGEKVACSNLDILYCKRGEYKVALDYCQRNLDICKELGDRSEDGRVNERIGVLHECLNDFKKAAEHFTICMRICQEVGDQSGEMFACDHLGTICNKIGDFKQAKEYYEKCILIAKEVKDRDTEERAWGDLGNVHTKMGNFDQAIKCLNRCLACSQSVGDRALEDTTNGNLGNACLGLGDFKRAMEHFEKCLVISKEVGDKAGEGSAYCNLGNGCCSLSNYKLAIQYFSQCLTICKELGDRRGEGIILTNLGVVYFGFGNFKQAIEFHQQSLTISQELKNKAGEGLALGNLGNAYQSLSDFKQATEFYNRCLMICKEIGDIAHEGTMYGNLGGTFLCLGDVKEAIKYHNKHLEISKKVGDRAGEGRAYGNLSMVYRHLGKYEEAVNYHKQHLRIFKELGDRTEEGLGYRDLGTIHQHLGDFDQAKECYNELLAISKETGNRAGEGGACLRLSHVLLCLDDLQQAMEFSKQYLIICKETGDIGGEASAYLCQGHCLAMQDWGFPNDAVVLYQASVQQFNHVRRLLQSKDEWKISLRNEYRMAYTMLWNVLLTLDRTEEALVAAEKGRAQALGDLLVSHYGLESLQHDQIQDQTASELLTCIASNTVFLAVDLDDNINVWLLQAGEYVRFSQQMFDTEVLKSNRGEDFGSFMKQTYNEIGVRSSDVKCEDRSLDALHKNDDLTVEDESDLLHLSLERHLRKTRVDAPDNETVTRPPPVHKNSLNVLYDVIVAPVIPHLRGNELIIVPDGQLFLVPFAALQDAESRYLCESFRIRVIPSLTCLKLVTDVPLDHHCKSGALIVGDPWVQDIPKCPGKRKLVQLQFARKEAEMIGKIVKSPPLIGSEATKEEVLRRLNSVALIHIAAHGRIETGEIALAPNPSRTSKIPREEDFLLAMSDVLSVGLRARLVVLSCCYSGRGEIKDEGVVGIARAFLGAGARSVLVSLWAIDDEATLEFMRVFYQHLADGKTASEALNRATNHMRESQDFNRIKLWAPFVLIGYDVTLECSEGR